MSHTKEPWSINEWPQLDSRIAIGAVGTPLIAQVILRDVSINEQRANAHRIVACVNACTGLSTAVLKEFSLGIVGETLNEVVLQRQSLFNAAKNLRDVKGRFHTEQAMKHLIEVVNRIEKDTK